MDTEAMATETMVMGIPSTTFTVDMGTVWAHRYTDHRSESLVRDCGSDSSFVKSGLVEKYLAWKPFLFQESAFLGLGHECNINDLVLRKGTTSLAFTYAFG